MKETVAFVRSEKAGREGKYFFCQARSPISRDAKVPKLPETHLFDNSAPIFDWCMKVIYTPLTRPCFQPFRSSFIRNSTLSSLLPPSSSASSPNYQPPTHTMSSTPLLNRLRPYLPLTRRSTIVTLQLLTAFHLFTTDIAEIRLCSGFSMLPTLSHQGDFVLISPLPLRFHESGLQRAARGGNDSSDSSSRGLLGWFRRRKSNTDDVEYLSEEDTTWGIKRGDIIIATSPTDPSKTVCKRVIGLEGDVIDVDPTRSARRRQRRKRQSWGGQQEEEGDEVEALSMAGKGTWEEADAQHRHALSVTHQHQPSTPPILSENQGEILIPVFPTIPSPSTIPSTPASLIPTRKRPQPSSAHVRIPRGHVWLAGDNLSNSTDSRAYGPVAVGLLKGKVLARVSTRVPSYCLAFGLLFL